MGKKGDLSFFVAAIQCPYPNELPSSQFALWSRSSLPTASLWATSLCKDFSHSVFFLPSPLSSCKQVCVLRDRNCLSMLSDLFMGLSRYIVEKMTCKNKWLLILLSGGEGAAVSATASSERVEWGAWAWTPHGLEERAEAEAWAMQGSASKWIFHSKAEWKNNFSLTQLISNFFLVQTNKQMHPSKLSVGNLLVTALFSGRKIWFQSSLVSMWELNRVLLRWVLQPLWLLSKPGGSSSSCHKSDLSGFVLVFKFEQNRWSQAS